MTDIIIQGIHGQMGRVLCELIGKRQDCRVVAGVDLQAGDGPVPVFSSFDTVNVHADVLIDFSIATAADKAVEYCAAQHLPCVICTTGLSKETLQKLERAAQTTAVFRSANMSLGVNLLAELAKKAVSLLGLDYDIEIIERHHHNKVDAPSGTALMLADELNKEAGGIYHYVYDRHEQRQKRDPHEIGLSAVRGGSIVGEHDILFCGPDEVITLSHSAYSRTVFANGAVNAALFLAGKAPGYYTMDDLLKEKV